MLVPHLLAHDLLDVLAACANRVPGVKNLHNHVRRVDDLHQFAPNATGLTLLKDLLRIGHRIGLFPHIHVLVLHLVVLLCGLGGLLHETCHVSWHIPRALPGRTRAKSLSNVSTSRTCGCASFSVVPMRPQGSLRARSSTEYGFSNRAAELLSEIRELLLPNCLGVAKPPPVGCDACIGQVLRLVILLLHDPPPEVANRPRLVHVQSPLRGRRARRSTGLGGCCSRTCAALVLHHATSNRMTQFVTRFHFQNICCCPGAATTRRRRCGLL